MTPISPAPDRAADHGETASSKEDEIADALLRCIGRWGLAKTTIEDVGREAGVSRATVYRMFPGGKVAITDRAVQLELQRLVARVLQRTNGETELRACLVSAIHTAATFLDEHPALVFMRDHEPLVLERVLAFDRLDVLFATTGVLFVPVLERFLDPQTCEAVGVWISRLVAAHLDSPSAWTDLGELGDVEDLVDQFLLPGIDAMTARSGSAPTINLP